MVLLVDNENISKTQLLSSLNYGRQGLYTVNFTIMDDILALLLQKK